MENIDKFLGASAEVCKLIGRGVGGMVNGVIESFGTEMMWGAGIVGGFLICGAAALIVHCRNKGAEQEDLYRGLSVPLIPHDKLPPQVRRSLENKRSPKNG